MAVPKLRLKDKNGQDYPNWKKGKLSEIADFLQGLTYHPEDVVNTGKVVLRSSNIKNGQICYENVVCVDIEIPDKLTLRENDVLMCVRNGSKKLVGKTAIITKADLDNTWGAFMMILRAKENAGFLFQYLNSKYFFKEMFVDLGTATINQITKGMLQKCKMMIPSNAEQQKIADFLTTFDKRIAAQQNIIADLEETKKGLLQKIFSQEIRFKDDKGQEFPDWKVQHFSDVCDINPKSDNAIEEKFYYIDIGSVDMGVVSLQTPIQSLNAPSRAQRILKEGDVLFQTVRPYQMGHYYFNKCNDFQTVASTGYAQLRCKGSNEALFIYQLLYTDNFNKDVRLRCTGTSYPAINSSDLATIKIKVPAVEEQRKIADFLSTFDKKISAEKQILSDLQEIKRGLLQQMFV